MVGVQLLDDPDDEDDPPLDPVQVPVDEQLVQVLLLPTYRLEHDVQLVTVPPLEYVPEEQALQLLPLT